MIKGKTVKKNIQCKNRWEGLLKVFSMYIWSGSWQAHLWISWFFRSGVTYYPYKSNTAAQFFFFGKQLKFNKDSYTHSFAYCVWLLSWIQMSICTRDHMAHKAPNIYYLILYRKTVLIFPLGMFSFIWLVIYHCLE